MTSLELADLVYDVMLHLLVVVEQVGLLRGNLELANLPVEVDALLQVVEDRLCVVFLVQSLVCLLQKKSRKRP